MMRRRPYQLLYEDTSCACRPASRIRYTVAGPQSSAAFNVRNNRALTQYDPVSYFNGAPLKVKNNIHIRSGGSLLFCRLQKPGYFYERTGKIRTGLWWPMVRVCHGRVRRTSEVDPKTYKIIDDRLYQLL
jgi:hypothetical protein